MCFSKAQIMDLYVKRHRSFKKDFGKLIDERTWGLTSTMNWPLLTVTGSFASTLSRWSSNSFACDDPKPGSASWWCHTKALSLVSMEDPSVASVYKFITGFAISIHPKSKAWVQVCHSSSLDHLQQILKSYFKYPF